MLQPKDTDWLNGYKNKTHIYAVYLRPQDTYRLKVRGWKNPFHANGNQKKAGVAIFISDKKDLKIKNITRDKEAHYIMIKGSIQEEDITIVNIYTSNIGRLQHIRQTLTDIKGEIGSNTIVGDFKPHLRQRTGHQNRKLIKKDVINDTYDEMALIDIFRIYMLFKYRIHLLNCTFSRIDHILGHKSKISKSDKIETISSIFSIHNAMRVNINYNKKIAKKNTNTWRLRNTFLNNQQVTEN